MLHRFFCLLQLLLILFFTTGKDTDEESESGTKWMLDQCAASFMQARVHAFDVLIRMEDLADRTFDQRMLFYGSTNNDRENAEFYLAVARSIDNKDVMESISLELERRKLIGVWRTQRQDEEVNILEEFQRHLIPSNVVKQNRKRYSNDKRRRKRRLPEGRIAALDELVQQYMSFRAAADFSARQAAALTAMMAEGLPKRWAQKYSTVMKGVETKGLDYIHVLHEKWKKLAEKLAFDLAKKVAETGREQYSIGGEDDPDGRMLVLNAFENVPEWVKYVSEKETGTDKNGKNGGTRTSEVNSKIDDKIGDDTHSSISAYHNVPLPVRKPRPKVEIAQYVRNMYLDWPSWKDKGPWRIFVFTIGGGFFAGLFIVSGRWCREKCTPKRKKRAVVLPPLPGSPVKRVKIL
jgi:hypothetical protein